MNMQTNPKEVYYYVSTGEKSYFYTLNVSYIDIVYKRGAPPMCKPIPMAVRRYQFIKNLSHDFEAAQEAAKAWVKEKNISFPLKLLSEPKAMSEREKGILAAYLARIEAGYLPFGKYADRHVSEVDKSYIHWVVKNLYDPEVAEGEQNEMAQICYNYADQQGWIKEWLEQASANLCPEGYSDELNSIINGEIFPMGKYEGQAYSEIAYTKKGTLKVAVQNYLDWLSKSDNHVKKLVREGIIEPELCEDGNEYYVLKSEHFKDQRNGKPDNFLLTVLMIKNLRRKKRNKDIADKDLHRPLFRFDWQERQLSEREALQLSKG